MRGKNKCKILKEIRQRIADENDIPYVTQDCSYQGECSGTCPKCEAELRYLEQQLEKRQRLGKTVTVAALSASLMAGLTACPSTQVDGGLPTTIEQTEQTQAVKGELQTDPSTCATESTIDWGIRGSVESTEPIVYGEMPAPEESVYELEGDVAYIEDPESNE